MLGEQGRPAGTRDDKGDNITFIPDRGNRTSYREVIERIIAERRDPRVIVREAPVLAEHGEIGRGRDRPDNIRSIPDYGTRSSYLAARLKRDRPDIAAQLEAGAYPSVYAAARAAGIVPPTNIRGSRCARRPASLTSCWPSRAGR